MRDKIIDDLLSIQFVRSTLVDVGRMKILIKTNIENFRGFDYFSKTTELLETADDIGVDFKLYLIELNKANHIDLNMLATVTDRTFRGVRFLRGYYLTDKFGGRVYLITKGNQIIAVGEKLEKVLWPYFIKYFLTIFSIRDKSLHVKAAAFAISNNGTLLFGRGGSGKTVFLTQMCLNGATFLSNTHTIIKNSTIYGAPSTMRVRDDLYFSKIISSHNLPSSLDPNEYVLDPCSFFPRIEEFAPLKNICLLDYSQNEMIIKKDINPKKLTDFLEQFGLALNVYGLKDDLLDWVDNDYLRFAKIHHNMKNELKEIIENSNCYYLRCDILKPEVQKRVFNILS